MQQIKQRSQRCTSVILYQPPKAHELRVPFFAIVKAHVIDTVKFLAASFFVLFSFFFFIGMMIVFGE